MYILYNALIDIVISVPCSHLFLQTLKNKTSSISNTNSEIDYLCGQGKVFVFRIQ